MFLKKKDKNCNDKHAFLIFCSLACFLFYGSPPSFITSVDSSQHSSWLLTCPWLPSCCLFRLVSFVFLIYLNGFSFLQLQTKLIKISQINYFLCFCIHQESHTGNRLCNIAWRKQRRGCHSHSLEVLI